MRLGRQGQVPFGNGSVPLTLSRLYGVVLILLGLVPQALRLAVGAGVLGPNTFNFSG